MKYPGAAGRLGSRAGEGLALSRKALASFHGDRWEGERLGGRWGASPERSHWGLTSSMKKRPGPLLRGGEHGWGEGF